MHKYNPCELIEEAIDRFQFEGEWLEYKPFGNGHINDTFLLTIKQQEEEVPYIFQRINQDVFLKPEEVMENIDGVTSFLRKKILEEGGDVQRETLNLVHTKDGKCYYRDKNGNYWRCYRFIQDSFCYDQADTPEVFYESGVAFGHFQKMLADYPAVTLYETIENFHNTKNRFTIFKKALEADVLGRAAFVKKEADFILEREDFASVLEDKKQRGEFPIRVTHNDTKLNNIMMDKKTGKGLCVIDLDTVMPGLSVHDFGDSIRFGASTAAEDEKDLSKVACDLHLFELYTKGFLEGCGGKLTKMETDHLVTGAIIMTLECGIRFLTDYLQGDTYFKIHYEGQNLDRARTQLKLVSDMEQKRARMEAIVDKYVK